MDFLTVAIIRLVLPLAILWFPLPGFLLAAHLDKLDWEWLDMANRSAEEVAFYQVWDKSLDTFHLFLALLVALLWKDRTVRYLAIATFSYRLVGVLIFLGTANHTVLILFPNVFERVFLFYVIFRIFTQRQKMALRPESLAVVMVAISIPKVVEEYWIHAVGDRPWHMYTVLPESISSSRSEYYLWSLILLALPALAMAWLLLIEPRLPHRASGAERSGGLWLPWRLLGRTTPLSPAPELPLPALAPRAGPSPGGVEALTVALQRRGGDGAS
jgi:hypothetical protein